MVKLLLLSAEIALIAMTSHAQQQCGTIVEFQCSDVPGNGFSFCNSTKCVNQMCPVGTQERGPSPELFDVVFSDPAGDYETWRSYERVYCRYGLECDTCKQFIGELRCHNRKDFASAEVIEVYDERQWLEGVDMCWEW